MNIETELLWETARETAVSAGKLILEKWSQPRQISEKKPRDFVTDADLAAQDCITTIIQQKFPDHGFLTEEKDDSLSKKGEIIWIIDPVDGTTNYSRQHPIYCVSVAAARPMPNGDFELLAGAVFDPAQNELFHAAKGQGAWLNKQQIYVKPLNDLSYAIIGMDWSYNKRLQASIRDFVPHFGRKIHGIRSLGSATLGMVWVAAGRYDGYINLNLRPWDVAAAWLLIEEAGGKISNSFGDSAVWDVEGMDVFGSNGRIHTEFLDLIAPHLSKKREENN
ncbi:MAG: inositol monophosphatase [Chloroflexi bacterium]|nr:MAG: inositol monophosphatase [Chloroflexota bacterium]